MADEDSVSELFAGVAEESKRQLIEDSALKRRNEVRVVREEEQFSMEDGPSFVSPNGSFEHINIGKVKQSSLNDVMVPDPTESRRSTLKDD